MRATRSRTARGWRGVLGAGLLLGCLLIAGTAVAASGDLTVRPCTGDNDDGPAGCTQSTDGLSGINDVAVSPDGKSVYAVSSTDSALVRFARTATGALVPKGCIDDNDAVGEPCAQSTDGLNQAVGVVVSDDGKSVYVAGEGDDAITRFTRNTTSGALTPGGCITDNDSLADTCAQSTNGLDDVRDLAISPDGLSVYAVASTQSQSLVRFDRDPATGALTPRNCIEDNNPGNATDDCQTKAAGLENPASLAVSPDNKTVYTVSASDDAIAIFARDTTTGALTRKGCLEDNDTGDSGCAKSADGLAVAFAVTVSPDSKSLYVASLSDNAVARFARSTNTGALTARGCITDNDVVPDCVNTTEGLEGASDLVVSPDGESLYVVGATDNTLTVLDRNPINGAIAAQGCIEIGDGSPTSECAKSAPGLFGATGVAISPNGRSVYTAAFGNAISQFARTP